MSFACESYGGLEDYKNGPKEAYFSPYAMHGGWVMATTTTSVQLAISFRRSRFTNTIMN